MVKITVVDHGAQLTNERLTAGFKINSYAKTGTPGQRSLGEGSASQRVRTVQYRDQPNIPILGPSSTICAHTERKNRPGLNPGKWIEC